MSHDNTHTSDISLFNKNGDDLIPIIYEDENIIIADKPSTVPIHPCGGYNFNSMFHILTEQRNLKTKLFTIHRLDRLTSGVVICAKSSQVANELGKCIMDRTCQKIYLARVKGKFPLNAKKSDLKYLCGAKDGVHPNVSYGEIISTCIADTPGSKHDGNNKKKKKDVDISRCALGYWITDETNRSLMDSEVSLSDVFSTYVKNENMNKFRSKQNQNLEASSDTTASFYKLDKTDNNEERCIESQDESSYTLHLACPCRISSHKTGICETGSFPAGTPNVKPAQTSFTPLLYHPASNTTIVQCKPITGRTHQIRLHLQFLGHPIANDPNYGGKNLCYRYS